MPDDPDLALEFGDAAPDRGAWRAAAEAALNGRSFDKALVSRTRDDLEIRPLYLDEDVTPTPPVLGLDPGRVLHGWDVRQRHGGDDPAAVNAAILADLAGGVTSIDLEAPPGGEWAAEALDGVLTGVVLDAAPVALAPATGVGSARALIEVVTRRGMSDGRVMASLGVDPLGAAARGDHGEVDVALFDAAHLAVEVGQRFPHAYAMSVDMTRYVDAGATEAQELAWSLATGVAYLQLLEAAGLELDRASELIEFRYAATADQLSTIAKLRAARLLWGRVLDACGVDAAAHPQPQHAITTSSMFSRRDPSVNMLRSTIAALAAAVGGADAITVLPHDHALGVSDEMARRVARNTQVLLADESSLSRLVDPARGSYAIESLTQQLAAAAWERFQQVHEDGGMAEVLLSGAVVDAIDDAWRVRHEAIATRREPLTGVSEFPLLDERELERRPRAEGSGFMVRRLAGDYEDLRDAADGHLARIGSRPCVVAVPLGALAEHSPRSTWIANFLAAGGVELVGADGDGSVSPLEAAATFTACSCPVAVICGNDAMYAERAVATAEALKDVGASFVALAGDPGDARDDLAAVGVDEFWHVGIDALTTLQRLHERLEVGR